VGLVAVCALIGARGLEGAGLLWALPGALLLLLPLRAAAASGVALWGALLRASPAPLLVAGLGWGAGLLPALLWQLLVLWAEAPRLAARAARPGADALLLSLLALPLGAEALLRQTYLDQAWSAARLSGVESGANDEVDDFAPFWIGRCGQDAGKLVVWWLGGSAAGGAYQEGATAEMYFPAKLHERLCAAGFALRTVNFANGGRDSHTFSRGVDKALQSDRPDVVFAYWGVNDLLTSSAGLTRKEREAAAATRGAVATGLLGVGRRARLLNGAALWARPVDTAETPDRPAVPVADAIENHARLLAALQGAGAELVLIPEQARPRPYAMLASYREAQQQFVAQHAKGVEWVDAGQLGFTRALQEPGAAERLLVDSNHLAPEGHAILAEVLEGPAKAALQRRREARDGAAP
jgi:lysophospholipase L1-like esterase